MNKKVIFFIVANLLLRLNAWAQIIEKPLPPHPAYDSLTNKVTFENCRQYIGQQLYMLPISNIYEQDKTLGSRSYQFPDWLIYASENVYNPFQLFTLSPTGIYTDQNVYKPNGGAKKFRKSDYNAMAGKYFTVVDVIDKTYQLVGDRYQGVYFKLVNQENGDILYYQLSNEGTKQSVSRGPWICVGFFEKLKRSKGRTFIAQQNFNNLYGVHAEKPVSLISGSEWVCSDVVLLETKKYYQLVPLVIFKDENGNEVAISPEYGILEYDLKFNKSFTGIFKLKSKVLAERKKEYEEEQYNANQKELETQMAIAAENARVDELVKKYGKKNGTKIANGQVELGMTKDMCLIAWGEPKNIRQTATATGTNEKWFYRHDAYLRFKGNALVEIQN